MEAGHLRSFGEGYCSSEQTTKDENPLTSVLVYYSREQTLKDNNILTRLYQHLQEYPTYDSNECNANSNLTTT